MPIICISLHWRFLNENIHSIVYFVKSRFPNSSVFVSRFFQETGLVLITPYLSQVTASLAKIIKVYRDHSPLVSTLVVLVLHKKVLTCEPYYSNQFRLLSFFPKHHDLSIRVSWNSLPKILILRLRVFCCRPVAQKWCSELTELIKSFFSNQATRKKHPTYFGNDSSFDSPNKEAQIIYFFIQTLCMHDVTHNSRVAWIRPLLVNILHFKLPIVNTTCFTLNNCH